MPICVTCDSYGTVIDHSSGRAMKCPNPKCTGYMTHAEALAMVEREWEERDKS